MRTGLSSRAHMGFGFRGKRFYLRFLNPHTYIHTYSYIVGPPPPWVKNAVRPLTDDSVLNLEKGFFHDISARAMWQNKRPEIS